MSSFNFLLTYSKQIFFLSSFKRYCTQSEPHLNHIKLLKRLAGLSDESAVECLVECPSLRGMSEEEIISRLDKLSGFEVNDTRPWEKFILLKHHPRTIKHRYQVFKELGVPSNKISSLILTKYLTIIKSKVSSLKTSGILERNTNVVQNLLSYTPLDSSFFANKFSDNNTPYEIKTSILKKLLVELVGYSEPIDERWNMFQRLGHKSIGETLRNFSILKDNIGLPVEKIRANPFLLSASEADNTLELLEAYPVLAGVEIRSVLKSHCKILASTVQNMRNILQYLSEAEISDEALSKCFEVLTLNSETVRKRLNECRRNSILSVCQHHPRALELIIYHNKAIQRLEKLESVNCKVVSITLLACGNKLFNKFFEEGPTKSQGKECIFYLSKELGCSREIIKSKLQKHPFWNFPSPYIVSTNLTMLYSLGFSSKEILEEICILLYPTKIIQEEVDRAASRPESDVCRDENGFVKREYILPLALYYIEKNSNFEGKAMWFWESGTFSNPESEVNLSEDDIRTSVEMTQKSVKPIYHSSES